MSDLDRVEAKLELLADLERYLSGRDRRSLSGDLRVWMERRQEELRGERATERERIRQLVRKQEGLSS